MHLYFYPLKKNEKGFTLLETVVALAITVLCFSLLSFAFQHFQVVRAQAQPGKQMEFHLFLHQFEQQIEDMTFVSMNHRELTFRQWNASTNRSEEVQFERQYALFRRKVRNTGHQPMLTDIQAMSFHLSEPFLQLEVEFNNGESFEAFVLLQDPLLPFE